MSKNRRGPIKRRQPDNSEIPSKRRLRSGNPGGSELASVSDASKIIKDPVHGTIRVSALCVKIIDTPQFQRLRYLKQMGGSSFVYPGAAHNRFEHSIGTYYLAGKFARILEQNHPDLFEEHEITCIEIAALCHDLGHGPFSHLFDTRFMPRVIEDSDWKHEHASVQMLEHLIEENENVKKAFREFDRDGSRRELIKDIILGGEKSDFVNDEKVKEKRKKRFLYEIVANKNTGIDVDKWDYFARDSLMLGVKDNFDHGRYMEMARIIDVKEQEEHEKQEEQEERERCTGPRICPRNKEANNLYDMFNTRMMLHRRACLHNVTIAVDLMIADVLQTVDKIVRISGKNGEGRNISECIDDMVAYSKLNDSILQAVEFPITLGTSHQDTCKHRKVCCRTGIEEQDTTRKELETARGILKRIRSRDLYKQVGKHIISPKKKLDIEKTKKKIIKLGKGKFEETDFEIVEMSFNYGMETKDPIRNVCFYRKGKPDEAIHISQEEISQMLPNRFEERTLAIFSKDKELQEAIASSFTKNSLVYL